MRSVLIATTALFAVGLLTNQASAQYFVYRPPYVAYSPVTAYSAPTYPAPTMTYYSPAPTAPYVAASPVTPLAPALPTPTVTYYAPTPTVTYLPGAFPVRYGVFGMRRAYVPGYVPVVNW